MPAANLYEVFQAMQAVETAELGTYSAGFTAYDSVPITLESTPASVRFPVSGEFDAIPTIDGTKEFDTDVVGVFLIVGKRADRLDKLVKQAAIWKNRMRDAYKKHQTLLPLGTVHRAQVKKYVFDTIEIGGIVYFGLNYEVHIDYWRNSPVAQ